MEGRRILTSEFSFVSPAELDFIQPIAKETFAARPFPVVIDNTRLVASVDVRQGDGAADPLGAHLDFLLDKMKTSGMSGEVVSREEISVLGRRALRLHISGEWNNEVVPIAGAFDHLFVLAEAGDHTRILRFSAGFRPSDDAEAGRLFDSMLAGLALPDGKPTETTLDQQLECLASDIREMMGATRAAEPEEIDDEPAPGERTWAQLGQPFEEQVATFLAAIGKSDRAEALRPLIPRTVLIAEGNAPAKQDIGKTRVGGGPDLAAGVDWPRNEGGLGYNFLAQIDLAALPWRDPRLPADGLISIFNDTDQTTGPVLYAPKGTRLVTHSLPANAWEGPISAMR